MKINTYILSWDFILSIIITLVTAIFLQFEVKASFTLGIYNIGISVISIIFSLFFASMAILITNQDDDFLLFLEENNDFSEIISGFKFTLVALFTCLMISIIFFFYTSYLISEYTDKLIVSTVFLYFFEFFFFYSLFSTLLCVFDTIKFSLVHLEFIKQNNNKTK